ncbi:MAG: hypothetical protein AB7T31_02010 [Gemmatimonadales bacterium]
MSRLLESAESRPSESRPSESRHDAPSRAARWWRAGALLCEAAEESLAERRERLRWAFVSAPYLLLGLAVGWVSAAPVAQASALALVLLAFFRMFTVASSDHEAQLARRKTRAAAVLGRVVDRRGRAFLLRADQAWCARFLSGPEAGSWYVSVPDHGRTDGGSSWEIEGREGVRALRLVLAEATPPRAGARAVLAAKASVEAAGGGHAFLAAAAADAGRRGLRYATVAELPRTLRLALEIAVDEAHERGALVVDPALLEHEWRDAHAHSSSAHGSGNAVAGQAAPA